MSDESLKLWTDAFSDCDVKKILYIKKGVFMQISIKAMVLGMVATNCYIVSNDDTKEAVIIDPAAEAKRIAAYLEKEGLKPVAILLTHGHFDHMMAVNDLRDQYGIKVYLSEKENQLMFNPEYNGCYMIGQMVSAKGDEFITDGQSLVFGGMMFDVIFTPGHTWGGVCYYMPQVGKLFSGDTLFEGSVGRTDLATGSMSQLVRSIKDKLMANYSDDTEVLPGHGGSTTIGFERKYNPFL